MERFLAFFALALAGGCVPTDHGMEEKGNSSEAAVRSPVETLGIEELRRIDDFVDRKVNITAQYSSDGAGNGLVALRFIPVDFAGDGIEPPNGHEVNVTGHLIRRGNGKTAIYQLVDATWKYPPGPIKDWGSTVDLPEPPAPPDF